jgi:hypothetical protein
VKKFIYLFLLVLLFLSYLPPSSVHAQESSPWAEVFDESGNLRSDVIDLGVTTEHPDWMAVDLPFNQSLPLEANYHRYETASGDMVVLPSASTLFFMALNPKESGLADAVSMSSNGIGGLITFLGLVASDSIDWTRLGQEHPEYQSPDQFWSAVLQGKENVWTWFAGWSFITNLVSLSWNDAALRTAYLLYLNGSKQCTGLPGGCSGVVSTPPPESHKCPSPKVVIQQPTLSIIKLAPNYPLVVGQDTTSLRGADVQVSIKVPPVIFTWYEPIYEEKDVCRGAGSGETPNCKTSSGAANNNGVSETEVVFKECREHVEHLPDAIATVMATATLDGGSKGWIVGDLGQTHYGAFVHNPSFNLIPGYGKWSGGCSGGGTCTATGQALKVPFADPGTFSLSLKATTKGTRFQGTQITKPRNLAAEGKLQVYVTLPALVPGN